MEKRVFGKIGLKYVSKYDELEAGRERYVGERNEILRYLRGKIKIAIEGSKLTTRKSSGENRLKNGEIWIEIGCKYYKKAKRTCGLGCILGDCKENVWKMGFHSYVYFKVGRNKDIINNNKLEEKILIGEYKDFKVDYEQDGYCYIKRVIFPEETGFNTDEFVRTVKKLPILFKKCDEIFASAV